MLRQLKLFILSITLISIFIFASAAIPKGFKKTDASEYGHLKKGLESANVKQSLHKDKAEVKKIISASQNDDSDYAIDADVLVNDKLVVCHFLVEENPLYEFIIKCGKCEPDSNTCFDKKKSSE